MGTLSFLSDSNRLTYPQSEQGRSQAMRRQAWTTPRFRTGTVWCSGIMRRLGKALRGGRLVALGYLSPAD